MSRNAAPQWAVRAALLLPLALTLAACRRQPHAQISAAAPTGHPAAPAPFPAAPAPLVPPPPPAPRGKHLVIVYSSNLLGEYEPCG